MAVMQARLAQAHAQLALPGLYASLLVRLALGGAGVGRSVEVVMPELETMEVM